MNGLKKIPIVSSLLLIATYGVFGWLHGYWLQDLATKEQFWNQWLETRIELAIGYGLGLLSIIAIIFFFTAPIGLITLGMSNWFKADAKAFFAIAVSIVLFAIVIEYPTAFTRSLILSAAAMLFRLDLQILGCSKMMSQVILIVLSLNTFTLGLLMFHLYGVGN